MNTEKSIKLLKVIKEILPEHYNFDFGKEEIDEIIKRLQMWEEFKKERVLYELDIVSESPKYGQYTIGYLLEKFEKEYFSKRIFRTVEVEVEASNQEVINELAKDIEEMNGRRFDKGKIRVVNTRWARD